MERRRRPCSSPTRCSPAQVLSRRHRRGAPDRQRDRARADALAGHRPRGPERPARRAPDRLAHRHPQRRLGRRGEGRGRARGRGRAGSGRGRRRGRGSGQAGALARQDAAATASNRPMAPPVAEAEPRPRHRPSRSAPRPRPPPSTQRQRRPQAAGQPSRQPPRRRTPAKTAARRAPKTAVGQPSGRSRAADERSSRGAARHRGGVVVAPRPRPPVPSGASRTGPASPAGRSRQKRDLLRVVRTPDGRSSDSTRPAALTAAAPTSAATTPAGPGAQARRARPGAGDLAPGDLRACGSPRISVHDTTDRPSDMTARRPKEEPMARSRSGTRGRRGPRKPPRRDGAFGGRRRPGRRSARARRRSSCPRRSPSRSSPSCSAVNPADIIRELIKSGIFATINQLDRPRHRVARRQRAGLRGRRGRTSPRADGADGEAEAERRRRRPRRSSSRRTTPTS